MSLRVTSNMTENGLETGEKKVVSQSRLELTGEQQQAFAVHEEGGEATRGRKSSTLQFTSKHS